jgi:hypothetical protein
MTGKTPLARDRRVHYSSVVVPVTYSSEVGVPYGPGTPSALFTFYSRNRLAPGSTRPGGTRKHAATGIRRHFESAAWPYCLPYSTMIDRQTDLGLRSPSYLACALGVSNKKHTVVHYYVLNIH